MSTAGTMTKSESTSASTSSVSTSSNTGTDPSGQHQQQVDKSSFDKRTDKSVTIDMANFCLDPEDVRWFYKIISSGAKWTPLSDTDSLLIEVKYRISLGVDLSLSIKQCKELMDACKKSVLVLDDYYEYNFPTNKLNPIYWSDDSADLCRGTWFSNTDWIPLSSEQSAEFENCYTLFASQGWRHSRYKKYEMLSKAGYALFLSQSDIFFIPKRRQWSRYWRTCMNMTRVVRGYKTRACFKPRLPYDHLIFVTHGAGMKKKTAKIRLNTRNLRTIVAQILPTRFPHISRRPMFIAVEWRNTLDLHEGIVESITPPHGFFRSTINEFAIDLVAYLSSNLWTNLLASLVTKLNQLFEKFLFYETNFCQNGGKVSVIGHSLGSVLTYDVVTRWSPLVDYDAMLTRRMDEMIESKVFDKKINERLMKLKQAKTDLDQVGKLPEIAASEKLHLNFDVANLFSIGSPLGLFLALRGVKDQIMCEKVRLRVFNITAFRDVIAYRLEPLFNAAYCHVRPVKIEPHWSKCHPVYDAVQPEPLNSVKRSAMSSKEAKSSESGVVAGKPLPWRLDFDLRSRIANWVNPSPWSAHTNYWQDMDMAMFITIQLYGPPADHLR